MKNVLEYLEQTAERYPERIAVVDPLCQDTFQQLVQGAKKIGTQLCQKVKRGTAIPVLMEKSVRTLEAFLGIVYAGCCYVPVDPQQPKERMCQMMKTLQAEVVITGEKQADKLRELNLVQTVLTVEGLLEGKPDEEQLQVIRRQSIDQDLLYVIFTSGSTGVPKGVAVSHRAVIDFINPFVKVAGITNEDRIGNQAPFDFDVSVKDIYSMLNTGATLVLIPREYFAMPPKLLDFLCDEKITTLIWAVSALCLVSSLRGLEYRCPQTVRTILFSGEVMPIHHLNIWRSALPQTRFVNLYGPTEITCNCTWYPIERTFSEEERLPLGWAFDNRRIYLLDEHGQQVVQPQQQGEICVAGCSLASGYYGNTEQTEKRFVQNPLECNYQERMYRTGDLGYYDEEGALCFAGRADDQIKHMGHRIEMGEIEAAMAAMPHLERACCLFDHKKNRIVAFYEGEVEKIEVRRFLKQKLPVYMVPSKLYPMQTLPLSGHGKIDRQKLRAMCEGGMMP